MSKDDARISQLQSNLDNAEKAWHTAIRLQREASRNADEAHEKYIAAQLSLNTLLKILIERGGDRR